MNYLPQINGPQIARPPQATLYPGDVQAPFPPSPQLFAMWVTDSDESVRPGPADKMLATKFSWIYNTVRHKVVYDRHCELAFRPIIQKASDPSAAWDDVRRRLTHSPPEVIAIENLPSEQNVTGQVQLLQYPGIIFINVLYIQALERSVPQSANHICLSFVLFSTLMHELGHWVHDLATDGRDSGISMRFGNYYGRQVQDPDLIGESGFFLEGQLFGGVICHGGIVDRSEPSFTLRPRRCAFEDIVVIGMNHMRRSKEAYYIPLGNVDRQMRGPMGRFSAHEVTPFTKDDYGEWHFRRHTKFVEEARRRYRQPTDLLRFPVIRQDYDAMVLGGTSMKLGDFELLVLLQSMSKYDRDVKFMDKKHT